MRITVRQSEDGVSDVLVILTEHEADGVAHALRSRLNGEPGHRGPGYHLHLDAEDEGSELTISVLDPD